MLTVHIADGEHSRVDTRKQAFLSIGSSMFLQSTISISYTWPKDHNIHQREYRIILCGRPSICQ